MTSTIKCLEIDSELEKHSIIIAWNYWQRHYCHVIFFIHDTYPTINWNRIITVNYVLIKFCCIIFIFAMWQRNYFHMISLCNIAQIFFPHFIIYRQAEDENFVAGGDDIYIFGIQLKNLFWNVVGVSDYRYKQFKTSYPVSDICRPLQQKATTHYFQHWQGIDT